jgi:Restriction endonuclease BglI
MSWVRRYQGARRELSANPQLIVADEKEIRDLLVDVILAVAPSIDRDWSHAQETLPYWIEAAPKQRGRSPSGTGIPWIEVAEYVPIAHIAAELGRRYKDELVFPALPTGSDLRFSLAKPLVHLDAKAAGPNDRDDEVVAPPYQLSGDGAITDEGKLRPEPSILNSRLDFPGRNKQGSFYPSQPPIYTYADQTKLCITAFLKVVYGVRSPGDQPLEHMTLAMVPNGILLYDHNLRLEPGLLARGKDDLAKSARDRRCRVLFAPLANIAPWRVTKIVRRMGCAWTHLDGEW